MKFLLGTILAGVFFSLSSWGCAKGDELLGFRFLPNCSGVDEYLISDPVFFRTNALGLKDKDYSPKPAKRVFRILFLGGSGGVNLTDGRGFVPSFEATFNEKLKKIAGNKPFDRIEVVNGSENAYHVVRTLLRYKELGDAYSPHLVIWVDFYGVLKMEEFLDHITSKQKNAEGLATRIGYQPDFWPFPESWNGTIWGKYGDKAAPFYFFSRALRVSIAKTGLLLRPGKHCDSKEVNCAMHWHFLYLKALQELVEKGGSKFVAMFGSAAHNNDSAMAAATTWTSPEIITRKLTPWEPMSQKDYEYYYKWMKGYPNGLDISQETEAAIVRHNSLKNPLLHMTIENVEQLGREVAEKTFSELFPRYLKGSAKK